ncbi:xylulokinase [Marinomonas sp. M1K-6]|uniref:Xylulose kinase n=1 Tax=Marinomonas profundi TaxID=2726122 RepID=A0A847R4M6_9GAMM|nr:xylulokinase [Marinomonas profundi]NLQ18955.1 xylulokinase [Marinomonas profundi]UDV02306.1 xylulokinase [Marinomonas profundi]
MYLGLDLGTSGLKGVVIDDKGSVVAQASAPLTVNSPQATWSEQDPESWWQACLEVIELLHQRLDLSKVKAIGLSGQMHGATLLDQNGQVLRPCILWNDGRSQAQCEALMTQFPELIERSGNLFMPGFTAPKIRWVQDNEADIFAKLAFVLLPKDYLAYRLTGTMSSDCSDAAGTLWLNPQTRQWDDALLAATGLTQANMPTLYEGCDLVGELSPEVAQALSLPVLPLVAGAGDNAAGAVGMGVTNPNQGFISLGTSGVYFTVSESHKANPENTVHAFCHALPNRWHQMGVTLSAANSLAWFAKLVGQSVAELLEALDDCPDHTTRVLFLPYLSGERTPHNDPLANGQFVGLSNTTRVEDMTLAVLEGVAFSLLDCQNALDSAGSRVEELSLIGGGARSALWRQIIANVLNKRLIYRDGGDVGPGLGAARLALLGEQQRQGKAIEALIAEYCTMPDALAVHQPEAATQAYYQHKYALYQSLYQATKDLNDKLAQSSW